MTFRLAVAAVCLPLALAGTAVAAVDAEPGPGLTLTGTIQFSHPQQMMIQTGARNGSRLTVRMGFDGPCRGGALGEAWSSMVAASPAVRVRDGRFSAALTGTARNLGGVKGRTGVFTWTLTGRFTAANAAGATVTGSAEIRSGRKVIARCRIAAPAIVRLAARP